MAVLITKDPNHKIDKIKAAKKAYKNYKIKHITMWISISLNIILLGVIFGLL